MFAVRHTKAIGLALSQALLSTSAVHVVKPDMAWNERRQTDVYCKALLLLLLFIEKKVVGNYFLLGQI